MRLFCAKCGFTGNEEYFFGSEYNADHKNNRSTLRTQYKCLKCGIISNDYQSEESNIVFYDEKNEWGETMALENITEIVDTAIVLGFYDDEIPIHTGKMLKEGFIDFLNMSNCELEDWYNANFLKKDLGGIVVLTDSEYAEKYHGIYS